MPRFTITVSGELDDFLEGQFGDGERFESKSEAVRHYVERGRDAEDLEAEITRLQTRIDNHVIAVAYRDIFSGGMRRR